jgi:hypothetical protein
MFFFTKPNNELEKIEFEKKYQSSLKNLELFVEQLSQPDFYINDHPDFLEDFFEAYNFLFLFYFGFLAKQILSQKELEILLYTSGRKQITPRTPAEICKFRTIDLSAKDFEKIDEFLSTVWFHFQLPIERVLLTDQLQSLTKQINQDRNQLLGLTNDDNHKTQLGFLCLQFYLSLTDLVEIFAARQVLAENLKNLKDFSFFPRVLFEQIITQDYFLVANLHGLLSFAENYSVISKKFINDES